MTKCRREKKHRGKDSYSMERKCFFNRNGWSLEYIKERKEEGIGMKNEIWVRNKDIQRQEKESKIRTARYNKEYKKIMVEQGFPGGYEREQRGKNPTETM